MLCLPTLTDEPKIMKSNMQITEILLEALLHTRPANKQEGTPTTQHTVVPFKAPLPTWKSLLCVIARPNYGFLKYGLLKPRKEARKSGLMSRTDAPVMSPIQASI